MIDKLHTKYQNRDNILTENNLSPVTSMPILFEIIYCIQDEEDMHNCLVQNLK